ncbi:MAG: 2-phospho-L-lactate transferase CofD family protein, partial [Chloroflexota bacterium]|nr:2-phospho-L-lactate transferase CofD family protein [Chloroflexota bacterium]
MIVALAGGVGGAKLAHGLELACPESELAVVVNTADDFRWYGLQVSPDLDTVLYTLAGRANPATGWGLDGDTFAALEMLRTYGEDAWFRIGDMDLATHVFRTSLLARGLSLTAVTSRLSRQLGVGSAILPMTDDPVETRIETPTGTLDFQEYFVRERHQPVVTGVQLAGIERSRPSQQ